MVSAWYDIKHSVYSDLKVLDLEDVAEHENRSYWNEKYEKNESVKVKDMVANIVQFNVCIGRCWLNWSEVILNKVYTDWSKTSDLIHIMISLIE